MYHGVVPKPDINVSQNHLSLAEFEKHIIYLKNNYQIVPLKELFDSNFNYAAQSAKRIAITFDDGYENNFLYAYPILKKYSIPATIFVVSKTIESNEYLLWYDYLDINKSLINIQQMKVQDFGLSKSKSDALEEIATFEQLKSFFKKLTTNEKNRLLEYLSNHLSSKSVEVDNALYKLLSREQLREMSASGIIEIGSHSHTHPNLAEISESEVKEELHTSKHLLEQATNTTVDTIAFPDGSYNEKVLMQAKDLGYKRLLAVDYKLKSDPADNAILPRYCISNTTTSESNFIQICFSFFSKGF